MDITLSAEQSYLLKMMEETNSHLFITGKAGAGKSVLLRAFQESTKKKIVVTAPTGIAALNVGGQTIHSLFRLPFGLHEKGKLWENPKACTLLRRLDAIIIDEISMVRADILDAIDARLKEAKKNNLPFGGVQIIMFGDVYQLPPVVENGLVKYFEKVHGGSFFFNALVWKETDFKIFELTQVFRQKDPIFKDILNAVRNGSFTDEQIEQLNKRFGAPIPTDETITLAPTNNLVTTINQRQLAQLPGEAKVYRALVTGNIKESSFPTEEILELKKGAQIVFVKNDKDKRWINGTVGKIEGLHDNYIEVMVSGVVYKLERETWEEVVYKYDEKEGKVTSEVTSSFTQYPIRLAWAMTIHKSQGQTYEKCVIDLKTGTFAHGQMYVALSRCTSLEGLYLKNPVKRSHIIVDVKVAQFMARCETFTVEQEPAPVVVEAEEPAPVAEVEPVMTENPAPVAPVVEKPRKGRPRREGEYIRPEEKERVQYSQKKEAAEMIRAAVAVLQAKGEKIDKSALLDKIILESPLLAEILAEAEPGPEDDGPDGGNGGGQPSPTLQEERSSSWKGLDAQIDARHAQEDREAVSVLNDWQTALTTEKPSKSAQEPAITVVSAG